MPLNDQAPMTLRFVFAACAADPRTSLSATQRAAIRVSLADETWCPRQEELPDTWATVAGWFAGIEGTQRSGGAHRRKPVQNRTELAQLPTPVGVRSTYGHLTTSSPTRR